VDSDDETRSAGAAALQCPDLLEEEVVSEDDGQPWLHLPPCSAAALPLRPCNLMGLKGDVLLHHNQQQQCRKFSRSLLATGVCAPSSRAPSFWRPMKTAAAADADRAAAKRSAAEAGKSTCLVEKGDGSDDLTTAWQQDEPSSRPPQRARTSSAPNEWATSSFLDWKLPAGSASGNVDQPGQRLQNQHATVPHAATDLGGSRQEAVGQLLPADPHEEDAATQRPALQPRGPTSAAQTHARHMPTTAVAIGGTAEGRFHRTADGVNVVRLHRQATQPGGEVTSGAGSGRSQGRGHGINSGWGNNFVRIDLKVGASGGEHTHCGAIPPAACCTSVIGQLGWACRRAVAAQSIAASMAVRGASMEAAGAAAGGRVSECWASGAVLWVSPGAAFQQFSRKPITTSFPVTTCIHYSCSASYETSWRRRRLFGRLAGQPPPVLSVRRDRPLCQGVYCRPQNASRLGGGLQHQQRRGLRPEPPRRQAGGHVPETWPVRRTGANSRLFCSSTPRQLWDASTTNHRAAAAARPRRAARRGAG
jgi:hypothetical protein